MYIMRYICMYMYLPCTSTITYFPAAVWESEVEQTYSVGKELGRCERCITFYFAADHYNLLFCCLCIGESSYVYIIIISV